MSHLEDLIAEYYDWKGYLVKRNIKVGRLPHGGWEMELDIIAYDPHSNHLIHIEPSIDADSWRKRETRFMKKFNAGKKYIFSDIYKWLESDTAIEQVAVLISHPKGRDNLAGGKIKSIDELISEIKSEIGSQGIMANNAIPEQYPLLRTIQMTQNGYYRLIPYSS
jgi:hypothetical protein